MLITIVAITAVTAITAITAPQVASHSLIRFVCANYVELTQTAILWGLRLVFCSPLEALNYI